MVVSSFKLSLLARTKVPAAITACAMALSACVSPVAGPSGNYTHPMGDAPVTSNPTPYLSLIHI